ncbi:MAG: hypothetical protein WCE64_15560 [Bacteroidales bacterium]
MKTGSTGIILIILFIVTLLLWSSGCMHNADLNNIDTLCFARDVLPVFTRNCALPQCHDGTGQSIVVLDNYPDIRASVVPGKPYESPSYKLVIKKTRTGRMPPGKLLPIGDRIFIRVWIEQGALETTCPGATGGRFPDN